jgi:hypothetical protein
MRTIGERFPPLESRVRQWSKKRILDELSPGGFDSSGRDRVLAKELLKRDLTEDELLAALGRRERDDSGTLLFAVVEAHQVSRFSPAIREYLERGHFSQGKTNNPFDIVGRTDEVNFTDVALSVLRADYRANAAFRYVAAHGTTLAEYEALAELPLVDAGYGREWDLSKMRQRLGLVENSNPKMAK